MMSFWRGGVTRPAACGTATNRTACAREAPGDLDLRLPERLDGAEERNERRVLLEPDEVVEERRDHAPDGLRNDDEPQRLRARETQRPRRRLLARVHRFDPSAVYLRHVRR